MVRGGPWPPKTSHGITLRLLYVNVNVNIRSKDSESELSPQRCNAHRLSVGGFNGLGTKVVDACIGDWEGISVFP